MGHGLALEGLGLPELEAQIQEGEGREDADAQADAPGDAQVVLARDDDDDGGYDGGDEEGEVDLHVGEEDEPFVACALLKFAGAFGATDGACWVFSSDACGGLGFQLDC